ncbi:MAG TPA: nucleoside diphosphate kinase regulator [Rudaea sp.]|nr:nucleoside diphosphate kinase regulator [Rudaea sp.]
MAKRKIYVTERDRQRLEDIIAAFDEVDHRDRSDIDALAAELRRAETVAAEDIPANVVTMNSKVVLRDMANGETKTWVLVFPRNANASAGAISVLAPVGTAILGYATGDEIEWRVPSGTRRLRIEEVLYQPEAAGDFHL